MATVYQYDASGYFAGESDDCDGPLPHNTTRTAPKLQDGFIPRWSGKKWNQVQDHRGKNGYVDGKPFTVKDYGPLPDGWSDDPPPPTPEELVAAFEGAVSACLGEFVQKRGWDSLDRVLAQTGDFKADAEIAQQAYDATWQAAFILIPAVEDGTYTPEQAMLHLPPLPEWPEPAFMRTKG